MVDTDDTQRTTNDRRRTTPQVWHKLPTGELTKNSQFFKLFYLKHQFLFLIVRWHVTGLDLMVAYSYIV